MSMPLGASNHSPQTQIPGITAVRAWHTHGTLSKLSVDPVNLAWGYASHARPIVAPALPPASPPHRMQTWMQTKTAIVLCISLHSCIFLASTGNHSKPLIQLATRDGRPPGPTLGDLRPVPRFTASPQESADGLLGACDPLCRFLPVSFRQADGADGADGADEADGAPRCYVVDLTRPARDRRRHVLMNGKGMLDRRSCIITSCLLSRPIDHLD
jgi:hypothetical protein